MAHNFNWHITNEDDGVTARCINHFCWEFNQPGLSEPVQVHILNFGQAEIESIINAYGYTLSKNKYLGTSLLVNIQEEHDDAANFVIAECIYESRFAPLKSVK